jgi:bacteriorhodopsin
MFFLSSICNWILLHVVVVLEYLTNPCCGAGTTFIIGDARATFKVVLPSDLNDVTLVNISNATTLPWWRYIEWLLVCPATVVALITLQRTVEARYVSQR